jgi:hypothetical protein
VLFRKIACLRPYLQGPGLLVTSGVLIAIVGALDPDRSAARWAGPLLAVAGLVGVRLQGHASWALPPVTFALALSVGGAADPQFYRGDTPNYMMYLQSLVFDHDLDFTNEAARLGWPTGTPTPTGHYPTNQTIGAALLWSPAFGVAHAYVVVGRALGLVRYAADGFSPPYLRSALVGTLAWAVFGAWALGRVLARRWPPTVAALAVLASIATSPILQYLFQQPGMPHGLDYALVALSIAAVDGVDREPSGPRYALLGLVLGLLVLVRLQAFLVSLLVLPLVARDAKRGNLRASWLLGAAAAAFLAFAPQLLAWKAIYGHWLTVGAEVTGWALRGGTSNPILFHPSSWLEPRSLHLWEVLFGADRGFFNWTPAMMLGVAALPFALPRARLLAAGGLLVFVATAWFNGCFGDVTAGDSFGARRFDIVVPFTAFGFAVLLEACNRQPLAAPGLMLTAFTLWNVVLVRLYRANTVPYAVPLERLAQLEVRQAQRTTEAALSLVPGVDATAAAYRFFVGEYFYFNANPHGVFELGLADSRYLQGGWSPAVNRSGPPQYRNALLPRSCLRFPLMIGGDLRVTVTAKAPNRIDTQTMAVSLNGHRAESTALSREWSQTVVRLPRDWAQAGLNDLCLEFAAGVPSRDSEDQLIAAQVRRIDVRSMSSVWPSPIWGYYGAGR